MDTTGDGEDGGEVGVGSELTAARERAGLTVEQLSAATRIRSGLLVAMEAGDFSRCGGNFYARGHIRAIARAVKADPVPLIALFDEEHAADDERSRRDDRVEVKGPRVHPARPRWAVVAGAILVGLIGWGTVRLFSMPGDVEANASRTTPTVTVSKPVKVPVAKPVTKKPVKPPVTKKKPQRLELTIEGKGDGTYVTVRNRDNRRLFQGLIGPGTTQLIRYAGTLRLTVGQKSNIILTVNGTVVPVKATRFAIQPDGKLTK